jgi:hypothetical protein
LSENGFITELLYLGKIKKTKGKSGDYREYVSVCAFLWLETGRTILLFALLHYRGTKATATLQISF